MSDSLRTRIAAAKADYFAIPAERRIALQRRFNDAQSAARFHQEYRR